jgi:hypothetical protein
MLVNVRKNKFSEKESIFWSLAGLVLILSPLYIDYVDRISNFIGITYPPSLIFALLFIYVFFLLYRQTATSYKQNEWITELIQLNALYENELRAIKDEMNSLMDEIRKDEQV